MICYHLSKKFRKQRKILYRIFCNTPVFCRLTNYFISTLNSKYLNSKVIGKCKADDGIRTFLENHVFQRRHCPMNSDLSKLMQFGCFTLKPWKMSHNLYT